MQGVASDKASYKVLAFPAFDLPETYKGLVISRWCRSLKYGSDLFKLVDPKAYWDVYPKFVKYLLTIEGTCVKIAVLSDNEDVALGFSVSRGERLHYVHVDSVQRRQGIARELCGKEVKILTHVTRTGMLLWASVMPKAVFNPFA